MIRRRMLRIIDWRTIVLGVGVLLAVAGCARGDDAVEVSESSPASTSSAAVARYVHLGDSYASGTGVAPLQENSPFQCIRSSKNFAQLIAKRLDEPVTDVSCASADTADIFDSQYYGVPPQLDALGPQTTLVTMMLGGNDNKIFGDTIRLCGDLASADPTGSPCTDRYGTDLFAPISEKTYPSLVTALRAIREHAPNARVLIVGYPWIMPETQGCYPDMRVAAGDVPFVREMQTLLNSTVQRAAQATGVEFVDMSAVSEGHDACEPAGTRWIEPMTSTASSLGPAAHPNAAGQQSMADQVADALKR